MLSLLLLPIGRAVAVTPAATILLLLLLFIDSKMLFQDQSDVKL